MPPSTPRPRPRPRVSYIDSPSSTPSISSSTPFDWDSIRNRKPPPYSTPLKGKKVKSPVASRTRRAVVRSKGLIERFTSIPSSIAFQIALFPHNVPLPAPNTSAWLIASSMHFVHLCIRVYQVRKIPDSDLGWEDMYIEGEGDSWFDWTAPVTFFLVAISTLNSLYLFSRTKLYRLHHRPDPVSSPNVTFVPADIDTTPRSTPSITTRFFRLLIHAARFLLNMDSRPSSIPQLNVSRVQQLEIWTPGALERILFTLYSPAHALLWMATTSANWMLTISIAALVSAQLHVLTRSYETLVKDREIIAAEVMHEYNEGFVYPRVNPLRRDVAVMTHQAEIVSGWE